jgi:hypothetical protein
MPQFCGFRKPQIAVSGISEHQAGVLGERQEVVDVRPVQPLTLPVHEPEAFELRERSLDGVDGHVQVVGEPVVAWEAAPLLPGVVQEQDVNGFGLD